MRTSIWIALLVGGIALLSACSDDDNANTTQASPSNTSADADVDTSMDTETSNTTQDTGGAMPDSGTPDADEPIDDRWPGSCVAEYDYDNNGTIDARTEHSYDALGNRLVEARDHDADGIVDQAESWTYADMLETSHSLDMDGDGEPEQVYTHIYNAQGLRVETEVDGAINSFIPNPVDGVVDRRIRFTWDASSDRQRTIETDRGDDGELDELGTWTYEGEHRAILEIDDGLDGAIEQRIIFDREDTEFGSIFTEERDGEPNGNIPHTADGESDFWHTRVYEGGRKQSDTLAYVFGGMGEPSSLTTNYFYDENTGWLVRTTFTSTPEDLFPPNTTTYTHTERGDIARAEVDEFNDGTIDAVYVYDYGCWEE